MTRILLAESDPALRRSIAEALEAAGYIVIQTESGSITQEILLLNPSFRLLIIDAELADIPPGRVLTRLLRTEAELKELPVIMLTSSTEMHEVDEHLELGAVYFVAKPVDLPQLLDMVARVLSKHGRLQKRLR